MALSSQIAVDWLTNWLPEGPWTVIEAYPDKPAAGWVAATFTPANVDLLISWIESRNGRCNLYFTVNTPRPGVRTTPLRDDIVLINALHLDVDLPKNTPPSEEEFAKLLVRIRTISPEPTAIIFSGGGYQCFWLFDTPLPATRYVDQIEGLIAALEKKIPADNCHNANRLMRLPGTLNLPSPTKVARGRVPAESYVVEADWSRRWSLSHDPAPRPQEDTPEVDDGPTLSDLPPKVRKAIRTGDASEHGNDRNRLVWYVITMLIRLGWSDQNILPFIVDQRYKLSAHCLAQSHPQAYAARQITEARAKVAIDWRRSVNGAILKDDQLNMRRAIDALGAKFESDVFMQRPYINGVGPRRLVDDEELISLRFSIDRSFGFMPGKGIFEEMASLLAHEAPRHPVREYLAAQVWDRIPRLGHPNEQLPGWLTTYGNAQNTTYVRAVGRLILIAAVRRVRSPGVKFDEMLVFVDPKQGTNKSSSLRALCPESTWFSDSLHLGAGAKEAIEQLSGKWIVEASDLAGMRRSDVEQLKSFLSRQSDHARLAYGHFPKEAPRQNVFFGSTNELAFLKDIDNRRFWPVLTGVFDVAALERDRDQIWAEAAYAEAQGEPIRLDPSLYDVAAEAQREHRQEEPWVDAIYDVIGDLTGRILISDVWYIVNKPLHFRTQEDNRRLGVSMRELGWTRKMARHADGNPHSCYVKGEDNRAVYIIRDEVTGAVSAGYTPDSTANLDATYRTKSEFDPPF